MLDRLREWWNRPDPMTAIILFQMEQTHEWIDKWWRKAGWSRLWKRAAKKYYAMVIEDEYFDKWIHAQADADRRRELLEKALPYLVDYQHIFEGECIEDMNILSYFIEDIEEELAGD